ncbi:N-acetyltransferase [Ammoniphilus sp. CFH 90114]|uniref:N-acetyltransferase n=1 Tax=Ammoniphilus sp. CFH 90114 TaxID=2493665 RepID=UPI00100F6C16|nr:N-acetyltransferase [Ammoniphilus sp. CFH 90114]RXT02297.1 N-acetyltransferase [Ammoniphilus sp. CFH 90114]
MMIRPMRAEDMNTVVDIWYRGSIQAHDFIEREYWEAGKKDMLEQYLPMSMTYILEDENRNVTGFVSMVDQYLAALFVDVSQQKKGYGKQILAFIKEKYDAVQLKVYQKNSNAVEFYRKNGFNIREELIDEATSQEEFLMTWVKLEDTIEV